VLAIPASPPSLRPHREHESLQRLERPSCPLAGAREGCSAECAPYRCGRCAYVCFWRLGCPAVPVDAAFRKSAHVGTRESSKTDRHSHWRSPRGSKELICTPNASRAETRAVTRDVTRAITAKQHVLPACCLAAETVSWTPLAESEK